MPGSHNGAMAANPHPLHITTEYWWFIEQLQLLELLDTVFAGAWGRNKPGGHCDAYYLHWYKENGVYVWRNDYTMRHPDDKVLGTPLDQFSASTDWTFRSAQRGDFTNISKYGRRIAVAFAARDPRLFGWHEVLIQADMDKAPEGFNFRSWTTRIPDSTHEWHGHFTCSRKYLRSLSVFQAMLSILRGETLAQWEAQGDDVMAQVFLWNGKYWISKGDAKERSQVPGVVGKVSPEMNVVTSAHKVYPGRDALGYPTPDLITRDWTEALVDLAYGKVAASTGGGTGDGASAEEVRVIVHDELSKLTLVSDVE